MLKRQTKWSSSLLSSSSFSSSCTTRTRTCSLSSFLSRFLLQCFPISFTALLRRQTIVTILTLSTSTSGSSFTVTLSLTSTWRLRIKNQKLELKKTTHFVLVSQIQNPYKIHKQHSRNIQQDLVFIQTEQSRNETTIASSPKTNPKFENFNP